MSINDKFGVTFKSGDIVFLEHEPGDSVYLIQKGIIKISKVVEDREKTMAILEPGAIFGEMSIIENAPRSATAIAQTDAELLFFKKENFDVLLQSNPPMALRILTLFAKRIYEQKRRLMILALEDDEHKVLDVILMLAEQDGCNTNSIQEVEINANSEQIAAWAAISPKFSKKVLDHYSKFGRISFKGERIVVKNINEIQRIVASKRK